MVEVLDPVGCRGGHLAAGHAVDHVIGTDDLEVDISSGRMNQMIPPDGSQVSVAADDHDAQVGVEELGPGGKGQGPAVEGVQGIPGKMGAGDPGRTADTGDKKHLVHVHL